MKKISVIIPMCNAEKYLGQCLNSVYNQTLKDIEVIIIDDGSKDSSLKIANQFINKNNIQTKIITGPNKGAGSARNKGLDIAEGEFIKFVDADDYLNPNTLELMYNIAIENNAEIVRGNLNLINNNEIVEQNSNWWFYRKGFSIINPKKEKDFIVIEIPAIGNKLFKKSIFNNLRFPEHLKWEDLAIIPLALASANKIVYLDEPVYNYRLDNNTTSDDFEKPNSNILDIIDIVTILEKHMQDKKLYQTYKKQIEGIYILHSLFRIENVMSWSNFSDNDKKTIINIIINLIENKYPNWKTNEYVEMFKQNQTVFNDSVGDAPFIRNMKKLNTYLDKKTNKCLNLEEAKIRIKKLF